MFHLKSTAFPRLRKEGKSFSTHQRFLPLHLFHDPVLGCPLSLTRICNACCHLQSDLMPSFKPCLFSVTVHRMNPLFSHHFSPAKIHLFSESVEYKYPSRCTSIATDPTTIENLAILSQSLFQPAFVLYLTARSSHTLVLTTLLWSTEFLG